MANLEVKNPHTVHFASFFIATLAINLHFFQRGGQTRSRQCFFANRINRQGQVTSRLNLEELLKSCFRNFWGFMCTQSRMQAWSAHRWLSA